MKELSLNILDLAQNGIRAGAKTIKIEINENEKGYYIFRIQDDGCGMSEEMVQRVRDPFTTTRTTRKVGLGLPLIDMETAQCGGYLNIKSALGQGTLIEAAFVKDNIDRPPLGNLPATFKVLLAGAPSLNYTLTYTKGEKSFCFDTQMVRQELGELTDFSNPDLAAWVEGYVAEQMKEIGAEA